MKSFPKLPNNSPSRSFYVLIQIRGCPQAITSAEAEARMRNESLKNSVIILESNGHGEDVHNKIKFTLCRGIISSWWPGTAHDRIEAFGARLQAILFIMYHRSLFLGFKIFAYIFRTLRRAPWETSLRGITHKVLSYVGEISSSHKISSVKSIPSQILKYPAHKIFICEIYILSNMKNSCFVGKSSAVVVKLDLFRKVISAQQSAIVADFGDDIDARNVIISPFSL